MMQIPQYRQGGEIPGLRLGLAAGGAPRMWERVLLEAMDSMELLVPAGSRVLEVGYGDGLLSCYLCRRLGWKLVGLESSKAAQQLALQNAERFDVADSVQFQYCSPDETRQHKSQYDAVFVKTVLYNSPTLAEYCRWLDWVLSVLKPGGILVDFETGRANGLTQLYRRLRRREYTDLCLYTQRVEVLYDARFKIVKRSYYGGWSQFLAPVPRLYTMAASLEEKLQPRHADNCFIVSIIARRPEGLIRPAEE